MPGDRESLDLLLGDMAGHQAAHVGEVTPAVNQRLAAEVLERLDQKEADAKPAPVAVDAPASVAEEHARAKGTPILREPALAPGRIVPMTPQLLDLYEKKKARIHLLLNRPESGILGAPSWRDCVLAVLALKFHKSKRVRDSQLAKMDELLDLSNQQFGDWRADAPRKVMVG